MEKSFFFGRTRFEFYEKNPIYGRECMFLIFCRIQSFLGTLLLILGHVDHFEILKRLNYPV